MAAKKKSTKSRGKVVKPSLAAEIDAWHEARVRRQRAQKDVDAMKVDEKDREQRVLAMMMDEKVGVIAARGTRATATREKVSLPAAEDWSAIEKYIYKHKACDLFERRISKNAWREHVEAEGRPVPGIKTTQLWQVRLTSLRKTDG